MLPSYANVLYDTLDLYRPPLQEANAFLSVGHRYSYQNQNSLLLFPEVVCMCEVGTFDS